MRKKGILLLAIGLACMLVLVGCKKTDETNTTTDTTSAVQTKSSKGYFEEFAFDVPSEWSENKASDDLYHYYANGNNDFLTVQRQVTGTPIDLWAYKDFLIAGMKSSTQEFELLKSEEESLQGLKALDLEYKCKLNGDQVYKMRSKMFEVNHKMYSFTFATTSLDGSQYDSAIENVLTSIKIKDAFITAETTTTQAPTTTEAPVTTTKATTAVKPTTKAATKATTAKKQSRTVYVTPTGKKYHYSGSCNGGKYTASTLDEALSRGLSPCNKCVG